MADLSDVVGAEIDLTVISGRGLIPKDGGFGFGARTSDAYVVIAAVLPAARSGRGGHCEELGRTAVIAKNLNPRWDQAFKFHLHGRRFRGDMLLRLRVWDSDAMSADDPMGEAVVPVGDLLGGQVIERWYAVRPYAGCKKASGDLQLRISAVLRTALSVSSHQSVRLPHGVLGVGLGWDMLGDGSAIDLDASCVALSAQGDLVMRECCYHAQLSSASGAIRHSGDEREGDEDLGEGDDEVITLDLSRVPAAVHAIFVVATVASSGRSFADVKSARMRLVQWESGAELCRFVPAMKGAHTALLMARVARHGGGWVLSAIGEVDHTARDWGTLLPEFRLYMGDLCPGITASPEQRIAVMRGNIRLTDYCVGGVPPETLVLGLAWDVTNGRNVDLDASAILLDRQLRLLDLVFFGKLRSSDGSIQHGGDEREGDEKGDDEKVFLTLGSVAPAVAYIGFVINSYSGEELDDVSRASCHLFDPRSMRDLATFGLSNTRFLDKHTALVMGALYRDPGAEWGFLIISEAAQGRTAHDNVDELQAALRRRPPPPLAPSRPPPGAGAAMLANATAAGLVQGGVVQGLVVDAEVLSVSAVPMGLPA